MAEQHDHLNGPFPMYILHEMAKETQVNRPDRTIVDGCW